MEEHVDAENPFFRLITCTAFIVSPCIFQFNNG